MDLHKLPEDCLQVAVDAAGGNKEVGHRLRPELSPVEAGKWLARCLSDQHAQRLNYAQEQLIYRLACDKGEHDGFVAYAESIGYRVEALDREAEIRALARQAEQHAARATSLSAEVQARMKAMNVKLEDVA